MEYIKTIIKRRSIRDIGKDVDLPKAEITGIVKDCLMHTPSAYNAQSQRIMLLYENDHDRFWDLVSDELRKIVPEENFGRTKKKIDKFKNGFGTVLFFDDDEITQDLVERFPLYKDNFFRWADQQNGMLQANIWSALAEQDIGASLQHYNEVIEAAVKKAFPVPKNWILNAQMPFGNILKEPEEKVFAPIEKRFIVKGDKE